MTQPTLGRQVAALEEELGVALVQRSGRGLALTPNGLALVEHVRAMGEAAGRVSLAATGQSQVVEGTVRITATDVASAFLMPAILADLRRAEPGITVELVASNSLSDLRRREADIALRSVRPADPDLVARKLRDDTARLYAAPAYLDRLGPGDGPVDGPAGLARADFIGFEDNDGFIAALNAQGLALTARNFPVLCANHLVQWALVKAGLGIGVMPSSIGDADPDVARAAPDLPPFRFELWLVAHREVRTSRRVRLVFDRIAAALGRP
jgi:DNA-binding transcriptional LysR family regulator